MLPLEQKIAKHTALGIPVTLVAASGSDANHGLPGAPNHPFPGKGRHSAVMDGCIVIEEAAPIDLEIQNSV